MAKGEDITTKFKVDISDLKKGITEANKQIKLANAEFKAASSGMDDWQKSSAGIKAKLDQLQSVLSAQNSKLENYKKQLAQIESAEQTNGQKATELKNKLQELADNGISKTSEEYKKYQKALTEVEKEQQSNKTSADNLKSTILNQQAAVNSTEKEFNNLSDTLTDVEKAERIALATGKDIDEVLDDLHSSSEKASDGFTVMKGALSSLVADGFRKAVDAAKEFATSMIDTAAEVKASNSKFSQTFGDLEEDATAMVNRVADATGVVATRLNDTASNIYAFARSNGASTQEAMALTEKALTAAADSAAYYDTSLEDSAETLQSFLKGNYANDAALGVSATEFTRNAKATELFGQKYNDLSEIQKQQTLLQMVTDSQELSGAMGQAAREADGWENVQGNLNEVWKQFQAEVGTPILEALIPIIQDITNGLKDWANSVDWDEYSKKVADVTEAIKTGFGWIKDNADLIIAGIAGITAGLIAMNVGTIIAGLVTSFKEFKAAEEAATVAQWLLNAAMDANPIGLIALAIAALVAGIVLLITNWGKVKEVAIGCWEGIKNVWNTVADWFNTNVIQPISNFFSSMWEGIKNIWSTVADWFNTNVIQPIINFFTPIVDFFVGIFTTIWENIQTIWNNIVIIFSWAWGQIVEIFTPIIQWFTDIFQAISDKIQEIWNAIVGFFTTVWENIKTIFAPVAQFFSGIWEGIKNVFNSVGNWFKDKFQTAWENIKSVFSAVGTFFGGIWDTIKQKFTDIGQRVGDAIGGTFKSAINAVLSTAENVLNAPIRAINSLIDNIRNIPGLGGLSNLSTFSLPRLATGGILKKGQVGLLEGSGSEAVVPLEKNKYWIKRVASEMKDQLANSTGGNEAFAGSSVGNSNVNNFTQIINAPKSPSRIELYRQTRNLLELKGGTY